MLREVLIKDDENILVHGRTVPGRDPAVLLWGGSGIELNVNGTELWVDIQARYSNREPWIAIEIDGALIARQIVDTERRWVPIYRQKEAGRPTRVRIIKEQQAMGEDTDHRLEVWGFKTDGEILPAKQYTKKIEFIGDSINSGEGSMGAKDACEWNPLYFSHTHAYPYMVAGDLDAEYRVISQGGWGLYAPWNNMRANNIPRIYPEVCGVCDKDFALGGVHEANDFDAWQPDFICVNLGTNDDGAFHNPPGEDEEGRPFKMHMTGESFENGEYKQGTDYDPADMKKVQDAARDFLKLLREKNPNAYIFWCYGIMGDGMEPPIRAGLEEYKKNSGDSRVEYLPMPPMTEETTGSLMHPGPRAHRLAADVIVRRIKEIAG